MTSNYARLYRRLRPGYAPVTGNKDYLIPKSANENQFLGSVLNPFSKARDNPFALDISYNYQDLVADGSGEYSAASGAYFDPTGLPGWDVLKTIFREFRLVSYANTFVCLQGVDAAGQLAVRLSNDPDESVPTDVDTELEAGAQYKVLASMVNRPFVVAHSPQTAEQRDWHLIDASVDSNNFGYAKEFGQLFMTANALSASSHFAQFWESARVVFRGFKGSL